jgi:hypothetical protein
MADCWVISGTIGTVIFGTTSMIQLIRSIIHRAVWRERESRLRSVKKGLIQVREMLTQAVATGEVIKTDPARQFIRAIGHSVLATEHHIDEMLQPGEKHVAKRSDAESTRAE